MNTSYKCANHVEILEVDNEWIIMDTENFTMTKVTSLGAYILEGLKEQRNLEDMIQSIEDSYDVGIQAARNDALAFLEELKKIGLVTYDEP